MISRSREYLEYETLTHILRRFSISTNLQLDMSYNFRSETPLPPSMKSTKNRIELLGNTYKIRIFDIIEIIQNAYLKQSS